MKKRTTIKAVKANSDPVKLSYCAVQDLFKDVSPLWYTCGGDGWYADIYPTDCGKTIVTGYQPFGRKPRLSFEQVREYEKKATYLWSWDNPDPYEVKAAKVAELRAEFCELI